MKFLIILVVLMFWSACALTDTKLSLIGEGENALSKNIKFPSGIDDLPVIIDCEARITRSGRYANTACFPQDVRRDDRLIRAINKGASRSKNSIATFEGVKKEVIFNFRVMFTIKDGEEVIEVYPNNGLESSIYGNKYYSPQRVVDRPHRSKYNFSACFTNASKIYFIESIISEETPKPRKVELKGVKRCENRWDSFVSESNYIQGMNNNRAIESTFREVFFREDVSGRDVITWPRRDFKFEYPSRSRIFNEL